MSTTPENQQSQHRWGNKLWLAFTILLVLISSVLLLGYIKTQGELDAAQNKVTSLENTVQEQKSTIETSKADTQYWSSEEQDSAIAVAAAATGIERRGPGDDFGSYLFHIEQYGTDNFRNQIDGTRNGIKTRGIVRSVDSADFSQPDKAVIRIGFSGITGSREARGFYTVTLIKADDGSILVDSFSGSTFQ
ncbi:hypothetical protein ACN08Y_10035 [Rothia sp. P5764]|uniref:hypothetical protein n=1 Tax=Rothia sp. P5764 TaxID=3402654 RepID=UPI003AC74CCB